MNPVPTNSPNVFKRRTIQKLDTNNVTITPRRWEDASGTPTYGFVLEAVFPVVESPLQHASRYPDPDVGFYMEPFITFNIFPPGPRNTTHRSDFVNDMAGALYTSIPTPGLDHIIALAAHTHNHIYPYIYNISDFNFLTVYTDDRSVPVMYNQFSDHHQIQYKFVSDVYVLPGGSTTEYANAYSHGKVYVDSSDFPELQRFGDPVTGGVHLNPNAFTITGIFDYKTI